MERVYNIPLRKSVSKSPKYLRAKKASSVLKEWIAKHMKVDVKNVKIGEYANTLLWERGIKSPPHHIRVKAVKDEKGVFVEILEAPEKKVEDKEDKKGKKDRKKKEDKKENKEKKEEKEEKKEDKADKKKEGKSEDKEKKKEEKKEKSGNNEEEIE